MSKDVIVYSHFELADSIRRNVANLDERESVVRYVAKQLLSRDREVDIFAFIRRCFRDVS